jgi:hypothetical protein
MPDTGDKPASIAVAIPSRGRFILELLLALLIIRLPYIGVPFKWLESYFHELSHGLASLLTGGMVSHIQLFPNGAGFCFSQGGWPVVIGFSGYFGAALWGYLIFMLATWARGIRLSFALLGGAVLLTLLLWGRDLLTIAILLVLTVLFLLPLRLLSGVGESGKQTGYVWPNPGLTSMLTSVLRIMGLMIMLNALASPLVLLGLDGQGDANMLAVNTWIPAWFWVFCWLICAGTCLYLAWCRVDALAARKLSSNT